MPKIFNSYRHDDSRKDSSSNFSALLGSLKSPLVLVVVVLILLLFVFLLSRIIQPAAALIAGNRPQVPTVFHNADWKPVEQDFNGVPMMQVPVGCFNMGSESGADDEKPVTKICFDTVLWIDKTEVTNAQFARFNGKAAQSSNWTAPNRPRESITWTEARDFCELRAGRLPTEAEWEFAARGPDNLTFPWGNDFNTANAVYSDNANDQTAAVGSKPSGASWVGALDMSGNVWEWVSTLYKAYPYPVPGSDDERDNWIAADNTFSIRTLRGGSWTTPIDFLRGAYHYRSFALKSNGSFGFRCVVSAPNS